MCDAYKSRTGPLCLQWLSLGCAREPFSSQKPEGAFQTPNLIMSLLCSKSFKGSPSPTRLSSDEGLQGLW